MRNLLIVFSLLVAGVVATNAQLVRVDDIVLTADHILNSAGDSAAVIALQYNGSGYPEVVNEFPDSIRVAFYSTDSSSGKIYFKGRYVGPSQALSRDSVGIISSTTAAVAGGVTVARSLYVDKSECAIAYSTNASGNGVLAAHKVWIRLERFFTRAK